MKVRMILLLAALALLIGYNFLPAPTTGGTGIDPVAINDANFAAVVIENPQPVLVDFSTYYCPPCEMMEPVVAELAAEFEGRAVVGKLIVDDNPATADKYVVPGFPTFLFFKNGEVVDTQVGACSKGELAERLAALVDTGE